MPQIMAYEVDIQTDPEPAFSDAMNVEIVEFALGYDVDADLAILMSVMLVPVYDPEAHNLRFGIREKVLSSDWRISAPDYTKEAVDRYIPRQWRAFVKLQIRRAVVELTSKITPENITMETYYSNLEQKALEKYETIVSGVHSCGYITAGRFRDEDNQKDYWLFTKQV
jgi:hypothetical protein